MWQPELPEGGGAKSTTMRGSSRSLPARGHWEFGADGPLAFLSGARQLATFRQSAFRLTFG